MRYKNGIAALVVYYPSLVESQPLLLRHPSTTAVPSCGASPPYFACLKVLNFCGNDCQRLKVHQQPFPNHPTLRNHPQGSLYHLS
jgi:hypothetical protein